MKVLILLLLISPSGLYEDAKKSYDDGDFNSARKKFERFLIQYPDHELIPYVLYWAATLRKPPKEAINYYETILNLYPESKVADNALFQLAQYWYAKGEYLEALKRYEKILISYPKGDCVLGAQNWITIISRSVTPDESGVKRDTAKMAVPPISEYTIQIGAFKNKENAEELKSKVEAELKLVKKHSQDGCATVQSPESRDKNLTGNFIYIVKGAKYYEVRIGGFKSSEDAEDFILKNKLNGFVVKQ